MILKKRWHIQGHLREFFLFFFRMIMQQISWNQYSKILQKALQLAWRPLDCGNSLQCYWWVYSIAIKLFQSKFCQDNMRRSISIAWNSWFSSRVLRRWRSRELWRSPIVHRSSSQRRASVCASPLPRSRSVHAGISPLIRRSSLLPSELLPQQQRPTRPDQGKTSSPSCSWFSSDLDRGFQ